MVGLLPDHVSYYPHMLAPGQKQRLALPVRSFYDPKSLSPTKPRFSGHVDAFAAHQSDAGITGKTRDFIYLCNSAYWHDEAHQRPY